MNQEYLIVIAAFALLFLLDKLREHRATKSFIETLRETQQQLAKSYPEETKAVMGILGSLLAQAVNTIEKRAAATPTLTDDFVVNEVKKWLGGLEEDTKEIPKPSENPQ